VEAVTVLGPGDDVIWVARTPVTATVEATARFLADHGLSRLKLIIPVEGCEFVADELYGWDGPDWWKPGVVPFVEEGDWLPARPGESGALELWSVRIDRALRVVCPCVYPGWFAERLTGIQEGWDW
jgi:hypothetical protein